MNKLLQLLLMLLLFSAVSMLSFHVVSVHASVQGPIVTAGDGPGGDPPEPQK